MNKSRNNAYIAMERFKIQSYNWDKPIKDIAKIYGVGTTFARKMRRSVGGMSESERIKEQRSKARALFKCHQEHYDLPIGEIAKIYDVPYKFASKMIGEVVGNRQKTRVYKLDALIYEHPDFGVPDEPAPISHRELAEILGVCIPSVGARRRKKGVLPYQVVSQEISPTDKAAYKVCRLTHNWGRPKGIDRHLEKLREQKREEAA